MAASQGMDVLPGKHSNTVNTKKVWLPDRQTDPRRSDPYVPLSFAGNTQNQDVCNYIVPTKKTLYHKWEYNQLSIHEKFRSCNYKKNIFEHNYS